MLSTAGFIFAHTIRNSISYIYFVEVGAVSPQTVLQPRFKFLEYPFNLLLLLPSLVLRRVVARLLILFVLVVADSQVWTSESIALLTRLAVALTYLPRTISCRGAQLVLDNPDRSMPFVGLAYLEDQVLPRRQVPWYCVEILTVFGSPMHIPR